MTQTTVLYMTIWSGLDNRHSAMIVTGGNTGYVRQVSGDYKKVLEAVFHALSDNPAVERLVIDFEAAMWWAAEQVLPEVEKQGCAFYWTQAVR